MKPAPGKAPAAKPRAGKNTAAPVDLVPGWSEFCAISACIKSLEGALAARKIQITEEVQRRLIDRGCEIKRKPDSMKLADGPHATGSAYLRRNDVRQVLSQDALDMLAGLVKKAPVIRDDAGVVIGIEEITEALETQPSVLSLNPAYEKDQAMLAKLDKALASVKGGLPDDLIISVAAETKTVVAEGGLDRLFREEKDIVQQALNLIASVILKPTFGDMDAAWQIAKPLLGDVPEAAAPSLTAHAIAVRHSGRGRRA